MFASHRVPLPWWSVLRGAVALLAVTLLAAATSVTTAPVSHAQTPPLSPGCALINGTLSTDFSSGTSILGATFHTGELIRVTSGPPIASESPMRVEFVVDGTVVDSATYPGTVSYLIPTTGAIDSLGWRRADGSDAITWSSECIRDVTPPELRISIDPTTRDVRVEGVDNANGAGLATTGPIAPSTCTSSRSGVQQCIYRATDLAGNSVTATLAITKQNGQTQVVVQRLQYSGKPATTPLTNSLVATFAPASGTPLTQFNQTASVVEPGTPAVSHRFTANWTATAGSTTVTQVTPPGSVSTCPGPNPAPLTVATQSGGLRIPPVC